MTAISRVLVVGGGIAGLTAATALARQDRTVDVVELHDRPVGAAITLLNRAVDGLEEVGLLDRLMTVAVPRSPQEIFQYVDSAGMVLPTPPMPPRPPSHLPMGIVVDRPNLARVLREGAEEAGASVHVGVGVDALEHSEQAVTAYFTDGSQATYDLVVGADGVRSSTRELIAPGLVRPQYSGTTMFRHIAADVADVGPEGFHQSGNVLVVTLRLHDGRVYIATGRDYDEPPHIDQPAARRIVRENLDRFTAPLMGAVRERITDNAVIAVNDYDWLLMPEPWHRGRVVLVGDAAHATTAHLASGGGMAIEDAVVLGSEVAAGGSVDQVLQRFMTRRADRARLVVETSVLISKLQQAGASAEAQNQLRGQAMGALAAPY